MEQHSYSGDRISARRPEGLNNTYQDQRRHTLHGTDWTLGLNMDRLNTYSSIAGHSKASTEETNSDEDSENEEAHSENDFKLGSTSVTSRNASHPFDYVAKDLSVRTQKQSYLNPGDTFGRRASMSQLSLYGDVWGQAPSGKYDLSLPVPTKTGSGPLDIPGDMGSFTPYQQPSLAQSRRNSRILPNPIQPPSTLHGRRLSIDEQSETPPLGHSSLSLSDHIIPEEGQLTPRVNGGAMLGGFVPGFDIWARKDSSLHPQSTQSLRRKSESVLHDLSAFAEDHPARTVSSTTTPPSTGNTPLDRRFSTSLLPISQAPDPPRNTYSPSLHPYFATSDEGRGIGGSEVCGICGIQKATISMGACGHRVCNVCYRHEKHRSTKLFQSATPPCPFCAHGVTTAETLGPDKIQHQRKSLPVISPHAFNPHPLPQFQQQPFQGHGPYGGQGLAPGNDSSDGYPYNRQYHSTYPLYSPHTAPLLRTGSGPSETSMSTRPGMAQFGHGHYQPTHMKPPTGPMMKPSPLYAKGTYAPAFQPSNPYGMDMGRMGSMDNMNMGRPGVVGLSTGNWKDGPTQDFFNDQFHRNKHQNYSPGHLPSFAVMPNLPPAIPPTVPRTEAIRWAVVRVTNIPWDVSLQDMATFFAGIPIPPEHLLSQNVHILMDRATGKTFNSAFVELPLTPVDAGMVAQAKNLKVLKGRVVTVELSNQDELLRSVFPKWVGLFENGEPMNPGELPPSYEGQESDGAGTMSTSVTTPPFVTRDEINALLVVCRNYKLHFSRKCAERPFENILSILAKYPWHQPHRVLPLHRDHIFELLKLSIESLRMHLNKEYNTIHSTLLIRMVRCAIFTPAFTERQKAMVLHVAGCACPEDIVGWMAPPVVTIESESSLSSETTIDGSEDGTVASTTDVSSKDSYKVEDSDSTLEMEEQVESLDITDETMRSDQETSSPVHLTHTLVSWASVAAPTSKEPKVNKQENMATGSYTSVISSEAKEMHHQGTPEVSLNTTPSQIVSVNSRGQSLSWSEVTSQGSSKTGAPRLPTGSMGFSFPLESPSKESDRPKGLPSPIEYRNQDAGDPNLQPNTTSTSSTMSSSASTAFPFPLAKGSHRRDSLPRISVSRSPTIDSPGSPSSSTNGAVSNSSSASILEAIKTITQSTPRLAKGSMGGPKHHSQCREGGETL